jgi:hypothetical protein
MAANARRGRRGAAAQNLSGEEGPQDPVVHSPPIPIPPPMPNINPPPPRYDEILNPQGAQNRQPEQIPGYFMQLMNMMQEQQRLTLNAIQNLGVRMEAARQPIAQPIAFPMPPIHQRVNIPAPRAEDHNPPRNILNPPPFHPGPAVGRGQGLHGNVPNGAAGGQGNLRTQHLKSSDVKIPVYTGSSDKKTPYDFIIELEKYQEIVGYTEIEMMQYVVPLSLVEDAYTWYRYEPPFLNWQDFRRRIRNEFQSSGYYEDMRRDLHTRSQGPTESLTEFIRVIRGFYERIGDDVPEITIVNRILRNMHPEYRRALLGKNIATLAQLKDEAYSAQELIKSFRMYRPPPVEGHLEPSLAWKPVIESHEKPREEPQANMALEISKRDPKLHFSSIDPFAYHHLTTKEKKIVKFDEAASPKRGNSPSRPPTPVPTTPPPGNNTGFRERRNSGGDGSPSRGCFHCNGNHYKRDCPKLTPMSNSGNERSPSPKRQ